MVFGINVSGNLANAESGELGVWVRTDSLSEVTGVPEGKIKDRLSRISPPFSSGKMDFVIRLRSTKDAERLLSELKTIAAEQAAGQTA
jgi:hypothetical protein